MTKPTKSIEIAFAELLVSYGFLKLDENTNPDQTASNLRLLQEKCSGLSGAVLEARKNFGQ